MLVSILYSLFRGLLALVAPNAILGGVLAENMVLRHRVAVGARGQLCGSETQFHALSSDDVGSGSGDPDRAGPCLTGVRPACVEHHRCCDVPQPAPVFSRQTACLCSETRAIVRPAWKRSLIRALM